MIRSAEISHWLGGFVMMSYPLVLAIHLVFFISYLFFNPKKSILSAATLLVITYGIFSRTLKIDSPTIQEVDKYSFSVLSYNLMYGNNTDYYAKTDTVTAQQQKLVLDTLTNDIICLQEFYNRSELKDFDLLKSLKKTHPYYVFIDKNPNHELGQGAVGLAIFSRFEIINKEEQYWNPNNNGILVADMIVGSKDTIRVINTQLRSMGIRVEKVLNENKEINTEETKNIFSQLKEGFKARGIQMLVLEKKVKESPYPVILVGDLNEMPYGYAYSRLRKNLNNSFEDSGFGFGFTYHKILSFLRIDNQFYDARYFTNLNFETLSSIPYSDHFPIKAWYRIKEKKK
ncbi:MAG: endonuclease/exonuclease/phosphatase family protein [Leadbetterella sp.]